MKKPKVLILRTAGTNCDAETDAAFRVAGAETALVHIQHLIDSVGGTSRARALLSDYQILAIPGGFSYGDDISAGILLATEMKHKLTDALTQFITDGKLIIGICNGFQVLVKAGLLPKAAPVGAVSNRDASSKGKDGYPYPPEMSQQATLAMNTSARFECRWVTLETQQSPCVFTKGIKPRIYLPVAHAEGRFTAPSGVLAQMEANRQVVFRYASAEYPCNPNGSDANIAGICDATGRIFGMMPHPERFLTKWNHPRWTRENLPEEGDGVAIFKNAVNYARTS